MYEDEDDEEYLDEEEEEYVYRRDAPPATKSIDDLVRPMAQAAVRSAPTSELPLQESSTAPVSLPGALRQELDQLKASCGEETSITVQSKIVLVTLRKCDSLLNDEALSFRFEIPDEYPHSPLGIGMLPPHGIKLHDVRLLPPVLHALNARAAGKPTLVDIVNTAKRWLLEASYRRELDEEDARELQRQRDEEERLRIEAEEKAAQAALLAAQAHIPVWQPLTAAEEDQHTPVAGAAPCKIVTDMQLPEAMHGCAARVGGRAFFYGGTVNARGTISSELHVLHIATRRVEVHEEGEAFWPPGLSGAAAAAIGKSVYVFFGEKSKKSGIALQTVLSNVVYELDTRTLEWKKSGEVPEAVARAHFTATPINSRFIVLYGGLLPSSFTSTNICPDVTLFDTLLGKFSTVKTTSITGRMPAARYGHSAVFWQDRIIIYGGMHTELLSETWVLDTRDWTWWGPQPTTDTGVPGRMFHTATLLGGRMLIYGGQYTSGKELNDLMIYDIQERHFHFKQLSHLTDPRTGHVALLTGGTLFIVGGASCDLKEYRFGYHRNIAHISLKVHLLQSAVAIAVAPAPIAVPSSRLLQDLAAFRESASFTDIRLGPASLHCHSFVLLARCPLLAPRIKEALAASPPTPLFVPRLQLADSYAAFVDWLYCGNPFINGLYTSEERIELAAAALELQLSHLTARVATANTAELFHADVLSDFSQLVERPLFADFVICSGSLRMPLYRALLACRSEYFRAMLAAGMAETVRGELALPASISAVAAKALHRFFITDELDAECAENVFELLDFADVAQLPRLTRLAERLVADSYDLADLDSVIALAILSETKNSPSLLSRCIFLLVQHFGLKRASEAPAWNSLSPEMIYKIKRVANEV